MEILTERANGICQITFNRPDKKNAITAAMYQMLADALNTAEKDPAIRVVVLAGHVTVFTAGNDLEDFLKNPPSGDASPVFQFLKAISSATKPVIAAVEGAAVGVGTTMLLHCDIVYASESAKFILPFAALGLVPEAASTLLLPMLAGYQRAAEKLLLGEPFDAHEAHAMGLVNRVVPAKEALALALAQAAKIVALPAGSVRQTKALMKGDLSPLMNQRMAAEGQAFRARLSSPEAREAFTAFFERRKPDFSQFD